MRKFLTILFLLVCSTSFAQHKYVVKVQGQQGLAFADSAHYVTPTQLAGKVDTAYHDTLSAKGGLNINAIRTHYTEIFGTIDTVQTIQSLENYSSYAKTIFVADTLRGGLFYYSTGSATPDSGTIFSANGKGSGYWRRSFDKLKINVLWFGAIPDGVTDNRAAIQNAINSINGKGGTVYFPAGVYIVSPTVYLGNQVNLEGVWGSVLKFPTGATGNMIQNPLSSQCGYSYIKGLQIYGNDQSGTAIAILNNGNLTSDLYIDNVLINHWKGDGINIQNGWQIHVTGSVIEYIGGSCIRLNPSGTTSQTDIRRIFIANNAIYGAPSVANGGYRDSVSSVIHMDGSLSNRWILGVFMSNNKIEDGGGSFQPVIKIKGVSNLELSGGDVVTYPDASTANTINIIKIDSSNLGTINGALIASWLEYGSGQISLWNKAGQGIYVTDSSAYWTFKGNTFWHVAGDTIHVDPSCYNISRSIVSDSLRNNGGVLEMRKNGVFYPQFSLPYLPLSGGTMTGSIIPNNNYSLDFGSSSLAWLRTWSYVNISPSSLVLQANSGLIDFNLGGSVYGILKYNNSTPISDDNINLLQLGGAIKATGLTLNYVSKTAAYTAAVNDYTIDCNGTFTVTLPSATTAGAGKKYVITNSGSGTITIATTSSQTFTNISGTPTSISMATMGSYNVMSTGTNWVVTGKL